MNTVNKTENTEKIADIPRETESRSAIIVRTSIIGIAANVLLAAFKAAVGILSHSIAVTLDAVNNLSDALSSVITIIGSRVASKRPDKKHPLGHGRVEYLSAMLVAAIVLYAGITSMVESVKKIIHPETPDYSVLSLVIIAVAVGVKIILGRYFIRKGKEAGSGALEASGADASFDAVLSLSVLLCAILFKLTGISLEALVGAVISVVIIGHRADEETVLAIKKLLVEEPEVLGAYDLFLTNYGPEKDFATVHVELPDTMTVDEVDLLTRRLQMKVYKQTGVVLTGIGVYSYNTRDEEAARMRSRIMETVLAHDWALQMHAFYADMQKKTIRFDVVLSFDIDAHEGVEILREEVHALYPDFTLQISPDVDISDIEEVIRVQRQA